MRHTYHKKRRSQKEEKQLLKAALVFLVIALGASALIITGILA